MCWVSLPCTPLSLFYWFSFFIAWSPYVWFVAICFNFVTIIFSRGKQQSIYCSAPTQENRRNGCLLEQATHPCVFTCIYCSRGITVHVHFCVSICSWVEMSICESECVCMCVYVASRCLSAVTLGHMCSQLGPIRRL